MKDNSNLMLGCTHPPSTKKGLTGASTKGQTLEEGFLVERGRCRERDRRKL